MNKKKQQMQAIGQPAYRYWQALYQSFYGRNLYIDVAKRWRGFGLTYLLLVIAIAAVPLSVRTIVNFTHYFNQEMLLPFEKLPNFYVQNGNVSFDQPMPFMIKNKQGHVISIIDASGFVTEINAQYPHLNLLITKDKIFFRPPKFDLFANASQPKTHIYPLNKNDNEIFVGKKWIESSGIKNLKYITQVLIYPIITAFLFFMYAFFLFVFTLMGQLCAKLFFNVQLKFNEACRLLAVAATPQIFLLFIALTLNFIFAGIGFAYLALVGSYFFYAVLAVKRARNKVVRL